MTSLTYSGQPTLYLDQNILDLFVKYELSDLQDSLLEIAQVVYSDETLKEIKRSVGYESKFLNVLKDLNACRIQVIVEQPNFLITDKANISKLNVFEAYENYCKNDDEYGNIQNAMNQTLFKFLGGRTGESLADIHEEQLTAFSELMEGVISHCCQLPTQIKQPIEELSALYIDKFKSANKEIEESIEQNQTNYIDLNLIKTIRERIGIGPKELNNIKPPRVVEKIWDLYKDLLPENIRIDEIGDFFQIQNNITCPDIPYHRHQKVAIMYNMLNTLGYFPDSNVHKERRFVAAMSDNCHASMASFCNVLLSRDANFVKKVQAIYEYLNISTVVQLVRIEANEATQTHR